MKLVLDTNVLIAAFLTRGFCAELFEHVVRAHVVVSSEFILEEFEEKLIEKVRISQADARAARRLMAARFDIVDPVALGKQVCRDVDDDAVLGTALAAARCKCIITGDRDLLDLHSYRGVSIVAPQQFWAFEADSRMEK